MNKTVNAPKSAPDAAAGNRKMSPAAPITPLALNIPEACRIASLGRSTVYELIKRGEIETRKVGRRRLILTASLRAFVEGLPAT